MSFRWEAQRHESHSTGGGIPDVSFVMRNANCETGWIELKIVDALLESKPNRIQHFKAAQEQWLTGQAELGIPVFLLVVVYDTQEWLWFHGTDIGAVQGKTGAELRELAAFKGIDGRQIALELIKRCNRGRRA